MEKIRTNLADWKTASFWIKKSAWKEFIGSCRAIDSDSSKVLRKLVSEWLLREINGVSPKVKK